MYKHVLATLAALLLAAAPVAAENPASSCVTELMDARGSDHLSIGEVVCYQHHCYTVRPSHTLESICKEASYDLMQVRLTATTRSVATLTSRATSAEQNARTYKSSLDYYERPFDTGYPVINRVLAWGAQNGLIAWAGLSVFFGFVLWALWSMTPFGKAGLEKKKRDAVWFKEKPRRIGREEFGQH